MTFLEQVPIVVMHVAKKQLVLIINQKTHVVKITAIPLIIVYGEKPITMN